MNTKNESGGKVRKKPVREPVPAKVVRKFRYEEEARSPFFRLGFYIWAPLFVFVVALVMYFFFPRALDGAIKVAYEEYEKYAPQFVTAKPAVAPAVAKVTVVPVVKPAVVAAQVYSIAEIKQGVQEHLVEIGMVDKGTDFNWKRLQYRDPSDLIYELYARLARGQVELCMGTVTLDMHEHKMSVTSELAGW
jgi:hypothetical protein